MGLAVDQKAPDHSTLSVFRQRSLGRGKLKGFEEILDQIVRIARERGAIWVDADEEECMDRLYWRDTNPQSEPLW